jgi:hypothetical protein
VKLKQEREMDKKEKE